MGTLHPVSRIHENPEDKLKTDKCTCCIPPRRHTGEIGDPRCHLTIDYTKRRFFGPVALGLDPWLVWGWMWSDIGFEYCVSQLGIVRANCERNRIAYEESQRSLEGSNLLE